MPFRTFRLAYLNYSLRPILWSLIAIGFFSQCHSDQKDDVEHSKAFKPIYDSTNRLLELGKDKQAIVYVDSATNGLSNLTLTDQYRIYGFHFMYHNRGTHDYEQALKYADSMLATASKMTNKKSYISFMADGNFARGDALFELGRHSDSYTAYYQGYLLAHDNLDNCTLSSYTYRMGMITYKQANYKFAVTYFKQSFEQNKACKEEFISFFRQQEVLDNIALSYRNQEKLDSADFYFKETLKYLDTNADKYKGRANIIEVARAVVYGNMADIYENKGEIDKAIELLKKGVVTNLKKGNDNHDAHLSELQMVQLYMGQGKDDVAFDLLKVIRTQLDSLPSADGEGMWNMLMTRYYEKKNDLGKAYPYAKVFHRIKDSLLIKGRTLKEANVNEQLASMQKQTQILALQNTQRIYKYAGIIFISMSLVIILLVYRNWKRSRQEMLMVSSLNKQILIQKTDLERTLTDLESSIQEKDRILRTVAHDLRNPLGGIASLTNALSDEGGHTDEQQEFLDVIKETAHDSLELINEILEATTSTTEGELPTQPVDINSLISNSVELMRFKAAEKNQKIILTTLPTPELLLITRGKIWRVMSNLISNAIKFSPVSSDIRVTITDEDKEIQVAVADRGIGIPVEIKDSVFNMFTHAKRPGTLGEKSFGLGLSICRQIVEKHQGKLWFENNPDGGATFFVRLKKNVVSPIVQASA
ncbi:tetratricopeptide repeat-containing sensor histidine kinase [Mucilaginibacter myungsuensis]|uniref:histidine kinase n=1 Tax=Mucilaginibacter myungsuensis TaxID=649104 RepID=A0A929L1T5_9SPHI|nr:ATP-binding protein [Mucilaginibacter myungsuensis]MBE9664573.1 hypothetical protein [Mucilaginibacter myungsuensis]MDN3601077.1 ATP-binding protein [Mucilaginibacter myungsuensis]